MIHSHSEETRKVLWVDDEPDTIEDTINRLRETCQIDVKLVESPTLARSYLGQWKDSLPPFHVAIVDLKFDQVQGERAGDGIQLASWINGKFSEAFKVSPRLGTVTAHKDEYQQALESLNKKNPFIFEYQKIQLDDGFFPQFVQDILRHSQLLQIDLAAMKYMTEHPPEVDTNQFVLERLYFGYLEEIQDESAYVKLWDPRKVLPEYQQIISTSYLRDRNITGIGQALRLCSFRNKKTMATLIVLEPVGALSMKKWRILRPKFDYRKFTRG